MKNWVLLAASLAFFQPAQAAPVDLSAPPNSLGAANAHGYVQIWREIDEVDFGNGLKLPLRLRFSSEPQKESVSLPLGMGFWCPLTDAKAYLKREKMLRCELICGKVMYLRRDKKDASKFYSLDKKWTGIVEAEKNKITLSRPDGWELRYEGGMLKQLKTDSGRLLTWVRNGNLVTEIREEGSANSPLKVALGAGNIPNGFYINGKFHSFELGKRPRVEEVAGQKVVAGIDSSVAVWKWPDGKQESFQFEVNERLQPDLELTDRQGVRSTYVWDGRTAKIVSSEDENGRWDYRVGTVSNDIDLPKLERTNDKSETEFLYVDKQKGIAESCTESRGHIVTEVFTSAGPLYGKVREINKVVNGKAVPILKCGYDDAGRLVRRTDNNGFTTLFKFSPDGRLKEKVCLPIRDPNILASLQRNEQVLLDAVKKAARGQHHDEAVQKLAFFYIHQLKDINKALPLAALVEDRQILFNIKAHAVDHDQTATPSQKVKGFQVLLLEFPEQKTLLETAIAGRSREISRYEK